MERLIQSPTQPAFVQDPYPFYERARRGGELFYWEDFGMVGATSHRAVSVLLRDKRMGRQPPPGQEPEVNDRTAAFYANEQHSLLSIEPPKHTRLRGLVLRAFTSRKIATMTAEIEALCHGLIDDFPKDAPFDLIAAYAQLVPVIVICRLLGVPEARAQDLLGWSSAMVAMYQARRTPEIESAASRATTEFCDFMRSYVDERRGTPGDDLISELIAAEEDGARLSTDELITTAILLLNAGHEATVHTLGNGVKALLAHGRPEITPACVEEVIRFDPPLHLFTRYVYEDCEMFGHKFRAGEEIGCLLAAANRDPAAYENAATFDPARKGPANTSFGAGIHFCVGAPLARLELDVALRVLFERCPGLRIKGTPKFANLYHFHGLERLDVTV